MSSVKKDLERILKNALSENLRSIVSDEGIITTDKINVSAWIMSDSKMYYCREDKELLLSNLEIFNILGFEGTYLTFQQDIKFGINFENVLISENTISFLNDIFVDYINIFSIILSSIAAVEDEILEGILLKDILGTATMRYIDQFLLEQKTV